MSVRPATPVPLGRPGRLGPLVRYALIGVVATAAHYAVLAALVEWAGWAAWAASGAGAAVGAQVAFAGNRRFTFSHRGPVFMAWWRFQVTALAGALFGMAVVAAGVRLGWHYLAAQALATVSVMLLTFALNRRWTFG